MKNYKEKIALIPIATLAFLVATSVPVFAEPSSVETALASVQVDILAILSGVALVAVGIMAVMYGWRYGLMIFRLISKG